MTQVRPRRPTEGFPWGSNNPTVSQRVVVALAIGIAAAAINYFRAAEQGGHSDFTPVWQAARLLFEGRNPYLLVGPGLLIDSPTPLSYPVPAFVSALPLTLVSFHTAGAVFIFASTVLLAWGATADGWHRLPMFPSIAFLTSAQLGQWSILMTAAVFIPAVAVIALAKPQASLPVVASSQSKSTFVAALAGAAVLVLASFYLMPGWASEWSKSIRASSYFVPPIIRLGGPLIALVLLRWRRREAWLILLAACVPQTWYPYNGLLLLTVAATYREACFLSLLSSLAWILVYLFVPGEMRSPSTQATWGSVLVATSYLPAVILVLRRPNRGPEPWWMTALSGRRRAPFLDRHDSRANVGPVE